MEWRHLKLWQKIVFGPFILLFEAFRIYVLGCFGVYGGRLARFLFCGLGGCCGCSCCTYLDRKFPAEAASIGAWQKHTGEAKSPQEINGEIEWRRLGELYPLSSTTGAKLFSGNVEPADIVQGQIGNCWLMVRLQQAGLASLVRRRCSLTKRCIQFARGLLEAAAGKAQRHCWCAGVLCRC